MYKPTTRVEGNLLQELSFAMYLGPRYTRDRSGDFTDSTLSAKLGATALDTLLLLPQDVSGISLENPDAEMEIMLTEITELAMGRKNSRTKVKFGQLHISDETTHPIAELVAVKYTDRGLAARQMQAARAVNKRFGEDVALTPLGFTKSENGNTGYLTRYEHSITTLDNVLWNPSSTEEQRYQAMAFAGLWQSTLHNLGIIHGDSQAKNIAYDSTRSPRYVDLEGAEDIGYRGLDTTTKRLLDIGDLFDKRSMITPTTAEEESIYVDTYLDHQDNTTSKLNGNDIIDTIRSVQEPA